MLVRKSAAQRYTPSPELVILMEWFRQMVNDCIRIGLANDASSLKRLSMLCYCELRRYHMPSCYKLSAISKAAGILASRKKSIRRGFPTKTPYLSRPVLSSCYRFKVQNGSLRFPIAFHRYEFIPLNSHTCSVLDSEKMPRVNSFTATERILSLCISKDVETQTSTGTLGVDRNLRNVSAGNAQKVLQYDMGKAVDIAENVRSVVRSFKRSDNRVRTNLVSKYGLRRANRVRQMIHRVTKSIVDQAKAGKQAIILEDIRHLSRMYHRGNWQGRNYRSRMTSWPFHEVKRQIEYKAAWEGVPVVTLTKGETRGTTMDCPRCGERLQSAARGDGEHFRQLWCNVCKRWTDRDVVAVMNISRRGLLRFGSSKGEAGEAVRGNPEHKGEPAILRVDASKLPLQQEATEPKIALR